MTLPDWIIERMHLDDVPPAWQARVEAARHDPQVVAALAALQADDESLHGSHPPARLRAEMDRRGATASLRPRWLLAAPAVAAMAALVLLVTLRPGGNATVGGESPLAANPDGVRLKGGAALLVHRQGRTPGEAELLQDGDSVRPGDRLHLRYAACGQRYGHVIALDGRGQASILWPQAGGQPAPALLKDSAALPFSYELDDAPDFERFVFVTASDPFPAGAVQDAAARVAGGDQPATAALALAEGLSQTSMTLYKPSADR